MKYSSSLPIKVAENNKNSTFKRKGFGFNDFEFILQVSSSLSLTSNKSFAFY